MMVFWTYLVPPRFVTSGQGQLRGQGSTEHSRIARFACTQSVLGMHRGRRSCSRPMPVLHCQLDYAMTAGTLLAVQLSAKVGGAQRSVAPEGLAQASGGSGFVPIDSHVRRPSRNSVTSSENLLRRPSMMTLSVPAGSRSAVGMPCATSASAQPSQFPPARACHRRCLQILAFPSSLRRDPARTA